MSFLDTAPGSRRPLYIFLIVTQGVGAAASVFTLPNIPTWYAALNHPAIAPPNWVFAPVWTTLYFLMALAAWRVWRITGLKSVEMAAFALQLALNFLWPVMFFALHSIGSALVEVVALDLVILATAILFFRRDRIAGLLFLPYLAWSLFATVLTHAFWRLNP
ncbi:MAG: tryptophan-rich sensory protein [Alphaproteobacteria bacterium]|nr:tryptophan-rich sensory protein [Alphaproteobacteria bacterium]